MAVESRERADDVGAIIIEKIKMHSEDEASSVTLDTRLDDLGIHSLELTEIIFDVEDTFGIEVEMNTAEAWESLETVRDIVAAARELIDAKGRS